MNDTLNNLRDFTKFQAKHNVSGEKVRCLKEPKEENGENNYFVYAKGSRKYGYRYSKEDFLKRFTPIFLSDEEQTEKWHKRIRRVLKEIDRTGLWKGSSMEEAFKNLLLISYAEKKELCNLYWEARSDKASSAEERLGQYKEKYPFMFEEDSEGNLTNYLKCSYIDGVSDCNVKSTYFGKIHNKEYKANIKDAISMKRNISLKAYVNYDTSFEMDFERKDGVPRAWYSEEYKGCGNGHYYLAVSENCAVFCEND